MKKALIVLVLVIGGWWLWSTLTAPDATPSHCAKRETRVQHQCGCRGGFHRCARFPRLAGHSVRRTAGRRSALARARSPVPAWEGDLATTEPRQPVPAIPPLSSAAKTRQPAGHYRYREDCLYLNVWAPPGAHALPVMLWLHGGGNSIGHGGSYSGDALAMQENVVLITINYRLGPLGWFSHPALATGDKLDDSGNYGSLDAIAALEWTPRQHCRVRWRPEQRHPVRRIGGCGRHAGDDGIATGRRDLFHRAIVQSGGFRTSTLDNAFQNFIDDLSPGHLPSVPKEVVNHLLVMERRHRA